MQPVLLIPTELSNFQLPTSNLQLKFIFGTEIDTYKESM